MRLLRAGTAAGVGLGRLAAHFACDRAGLVSWVPSGGLSGDVAARVPLRSSPIVDRSRSSRRASSDFRLCGEPSPAALDQRGGDRSRDHREEADPGQHHDRGDEPAAGPASARRLHTPRSSPSAARATCPSRSSDTPDGRPPARGSRPPRVITTVNSGDDPRRPARGQRIMQHEPRCQRAPLPGRIRRLRGSTT